MYSTQDLPFSVISEQILRMISKNYHCQKVGFKILILIVNII